MTHQPPDTWPDPTLEQQMLADAELLLARGPEGSIPADLACHVKALLERVRALEMERDRLRDFCVRLAHCVDFVDPGDGSRVDWMGLRQVVEEVRAALKEKLTNG